MSNPPQKSAASSAPDMIARIQWAIFRFLVGTYSNLGSGQKRFKEWHYCRALFMWLAVPAAMVLPWLWRDANAAQASIFLGLSPIIIWLLEQGLGRPILTLFRWLLGEESGLSMHSKIYRAFDRYCGSTHYTIEGQKENLLDFFKKHIDLLQARRQFFRLAGRPIAEFDEALRDTEKNLAVVRKTYKDTGKPLSVLGGHWLVPSIYTEFKLKMLGQDSVCQFTLGMALLLIGPIEAFGGVARSPRFILGLALLTGITVTFLMAVLYLSIFNSFQIEPDSDFFPPKPLRRRSPSQARIDVSKIQMEWKAIHALVEISLRLWVTAMLTAILVFLCYTILLVAILNLGLGWLNLSDMAYLWRYWCRAASFSVLVTAWWCVTVYLIRAFIGAGWKMFLTLLVSQIVGLAVIGSLYYLILGTINITETIIFALLSSVVTGVVQHNWGVQAPSQESRGAHS